MFYYIYTTITCPGVIVHELAHALFCVFARVKIDKICLFRFGNPAGYVSHIVPKKFYQSFLISFGPLMINSLLALFLFSLVRPPYFGWRFIVCIWLAIAIGLHSIPSTGDAKSLLMAVNSRFWHNPLVILAYPFILALYFLNLLKRLRIDIIYVGFLFWLGRFYL
ncbi:MAG: hypothetical protein ABIH87_00640 [bacterium]